MVMMGTTGQPVQMSEMQSTFQFQLKLPALPPLIGIQSAYADTSFDFVDNLVDDCEQFGAGMYTPTCFPITPLNIDPGTQLPLSGTSNLYDVLITLDALNDCDEFDDGNNAPTCIHTANYFVGPVEQINTPAINPVGTNVISILTNDDMLNACNEAGSGSNLAI